MPFTKGHTKIGGRIRGTPNRTTEQKAEQKESQRLFPLCQRSCRMDRIGTFGGADSKQWLDTDRRTRTG